MGVPIDFTMGRRVMRKVLEEVADRGEGCTLEIGLDSDKPFPGAGERFELALRLFGAPDRVSRIREVIEKRVARLKPDGGCSVESVVGEGMCGWRVLFPPFEKPSVAGSEAPAPEAPLEGEGSAVAESAFAKEYPHDVLVVDDSTVGRRLTVQILRNLGYDPEQAENGRAALRMVRERRFTLIFMDLRMPDMDGIETMHEIFLVRPKGARPAVIALTAEISDVERDHCIDSGMVDFLTKPCRPDELCAAIRGLSRRAIRGVAPTQAARPAPPWQEAPVIDEATVRTLWGMPGGRLATLLEDLYEALQREVPDSIHRVCDAAQKGEVMVLRHEIHQLTGNFDVMGARRIALLCRMIGDCAKGGRMDEAAERIADIEPHFDAFRAALEGFIASAQRKG